MANIKNFKFLRNETPKTTRAAAVSALEALNLPTEEGTLVLARYTEGGTPGSVLGIVNLDGSVTVLDLTGDIQDALNTLDSTLTLSGSSATDAHFTQVAIVDGKLNPTTSTGSNIDIAHIIDYNKATAQSTLQLATTDTIVGALAKIEAYIRSIDKNDDTVTGKVLTSVTQADGKVTDVQEDVIDLALTGYNKEAASTGAISGSDDIQTALSKLENGIAAAAEAAAVDGVTIVKDATSNKLKTAVKVVYVPASGSTAASIQLQDKDGNMLSSVSVADIVGNSVLKSSSYDPTTGILTLTFASATGTDVTHQINLGELFDFEDIIIKSDSTNYLGFEKVTPAPGTDAGQAQLSAKIVLLANATASNTGLADAKDVKDYVDEAISDLEDDVVKSGTVNGVAGTGSVTNNNLDLTVAGNNVPLTGYTALTPTGNAQETVTIAATDTTNQAFAKVEKAINVNEAVVAAALNDLDSTKVDVISVNGVQSKTPATGDVVASVTIDGGDIELTGYQKPASTSAIAATDTVNDAIGKLEKGLEAAVAGGLQRVNAGNGISVTPVTNNQQTITAVAAASNGTAVDSSALVNPISVTANGIVFAETLDAGYYA